MEKIDKILGLILIIVGFIVLISVIIKLVYHAHTSSFIEVGVYIALIIGYFSYLYIRKKSSWEEFEKRY